MKPTFGMRLRKHRRARGLTQQALAQALDVSLSQVYKWESDEDKPGMDNLRRLAQYFKVTVDELVGY